MRRRFFSLFCIFALVVLLSQQAASIINPMEEEAMESYFREKAAENYVRLIQEKTEEVGRIRDLISENPDLYEEDVGAYANYFIYSTVPFYLTAILVIGIYLIYFSGSPDSRNRAKKYLMTALICAALITVSPHIMMMLMGFSKSITLLVLSLSPSDVQNPFADAARSLSMQGSYIVSHESAYSEHPSGVERAGMPILLITYSVLEALLAVLRLRFYIVALFAIILPITITAYAFLPSKGLGKLLFEQTILWTFSQAAMALVLVSVAIGVGLTSIITSFEVSGTLVLIMEVTGFLMLAITPFYFVKAFSGFS